MQASWRMCKVEINTRPVFIEEDPGIIHKYYNLLKYFNTIIFTIKL